MNEKLLSKLSVITEEEQRILDGSPCTDTIMWRLYMCAGVP